MNRPTLFFACLFAAGCRDVVPAPAAIAFEDPEGRPVAIASLPVRRIVSTNQAATEWIVALGAGHLMVARTDYDRQPVLAHLPSIGGGLETSAEAVAALTPDVLLGWRIRASIDLARALQPFGIPVVAVEATDTAQAFRQLQVLAKLVGREARADSMATALRAELSALRHAHCPDDAAAGDGTDIHVDPPSSSFVPTRRGPRIARAAASR